MKPQRLLAGLRDGWLVLGLSILLFVLLEGAYRLQSGIRESLSAQPRPSESPLHPNAREQWWRGWYGQEIFVGYHAYDPYRGWWKKPYASPSFNVDSMGRRHTVQPTRAGAPRARIVMLGGSTMWGYTARDSFTISSLLATELFRRGLQDVEVVNLAQPAFNSTQEVITLSLELRRGDVPTAAVFLDGHNDVAAAFMSGHAGGALNEAVYAEVFEKRSRTLREALVALGQHSQLIGRLRRAVSGAPEARLRPAPEALCRDVAQLYMGNVRSAEALARGWGFATLFLRQPLLGTTGKRLTEWERSNPRPPYAEHLVRCAALIDSMMGDRMGRTYLPMDLLFDADTGSVFLDNSGHVTEQANAIMATRIADALAGLLSTRD